MNTNRAFKSVSSFTERRLSIEQAAAYMGIGKATLNRWRYSEQPIGTKQPKYHKVGARIYYLPEDLDAFLANTAIESAGDAYREA